MATVLELTATAIRLARVEQGRLTLLESIPLSGDGDPLALLEAAPLPRPLGAVRVLLSHPDLILRPMVQPPLPQERLDRVLRFELASLSAVGNGDDLILSWRVLPAGGAGDMRVLAAVAKSELVESLRRALATHEGRLQSLAPLPVGAFHAWRRSWPDDLGEAIILDLGERRCQTVMVQDGELLFLRCHDEGLRSLTEEVAQLRGISVEDATMVVQRLGAGAPADIQELVQRFAVVLSGRLNADLRFMKAQLRLERFEPATIYLAGEGARVYGLVTALESQMRGPVRLINPFLGLAMGLEGEQADAESRLPSPWCGVVAGAASESLVLDVMEQVRAERSRWWQSSGILRCCAAATFVLLLLAVLAAEWRRNRAEGALARLHGRDGGGLVAAAEQQEQQLKGLLAEAAAAAERVESLADLRRPGRALVELLNLVASLQDPTATPVYVRSLRLTRAAGRLQLELEGHAQQAGAQRASEVLNRFRDRLREGYPPIERIVELSTRPDSQRLPFHWLVVLGDGDGSGS